MKILDALVQVRGRKWPTVALETGYSESPDSLSQDADILLNGSGGRIEIVITVKMESGIRCPNSPERICGNMDMGQRTFKES